MFGNTEVWVGVVEWGEYADLTIVCSPTVERLQANLRDAIVEEIEARSPEARTIEMIQTLVNALGHMSDDDFFTDLRERAVIPWVTIERHEVSINPVSR